MDLERVDAAVEYKHNGYNCAQAVLLAFADKFDVDKQFLANITSGFGMGMGCSEATCGALCGAICAVGVLMNGENRQIFSKKLYKNFESKCGATICKVLKGIETGKMLCSCDDCVRNAVLAMSEILEDYNVKV